MVFEMLDGLLNAVGFSCSLEVLHGGLGINSYTVLHFFAAKYEFNNCQILQFLVIKSLDPDLTETNADPQHWKYQSVFISFLS